MVAAWIGGAYWFTASTSFANPAMTIARSPSDTFAGTRPADASAFVAAQLAGGLLALPTGRFLFSPQGRAQAKVMKPPGWARNS